jgi:surface antigen
MHERTRRGATTVAALALTAPLTITGSAQATTPTTARATNVVADQRLSATTVSRYAVSAVYTATTVPIGGTIRLTGKVTPAAAGKTVVIQRKSGTSWVTWTTRTLSASSTYSATLLAGTVQRTWVLRVVKPAAGSYAAGATAAKTVYVTTHKFAVSLNSSATSTGRTGQVTLSGKITPAVTGRVVTVYDTRGGVRVRVGAATTNSVGGYALTIAPTSPGNHTYQGLVGSYGYYLAAWSAQAPQVWVTTDVLGTGESLKSGDWIQSGDGRYRVVMQSDGNLVEYVLPTMRAVWSSGTAGKGASHADMQLDGNLVVYNAAGVTWASHSAGSTAWLVAQGDANLVIYTSSNVLWASHTVNDRLLGNEVLHGGQTLWAQSGAIRLVMQTDGNLVVYNAASVALWSTGHLAAGNWAVMQSDGNLVLYSAANVALWSSGTAGHPGAVAVIQDDTNFVVYQGYTAYWSSNGGSPGGGSGGIVLGSWAGAGGPVAANAHYGYPYPSAPDCVEATGANCVADKWLFYQGQCTSWVSYRVAQMNGIAFSNYYGGMGRWGNAADWKARADSLGITTNGTPAVGAVAWYSSNHVAYVEAVNSPTSVVISEMNYDLHNGFRVRTITTSGGWPTGFIHVHDR